MSVEALRGVLAALAPTVGVALLFFVVVRAIVRADAAERRADDEFGPDRGAPKPDNGQRAPDEAD